MMNAKKHIVSKRGSAIIMALVTITVLMLLGLAVIALSMGTLKTNAADATTNDTYYAAEAGVNSAIEQVKTEVSRQYTNMQESTGALYDSYYNNFFSDISSNAALEFIEPSIEGITTNTTYTLGGYDASQDAQDILIYCTSTAADGTKYVVNGSVKVKRIDLSSGGNWYIPNIVLYTGGTLTIGSGKGMEAYDNDVILGGLSENGGQMKYNKSLTIDPFAKDKIEDELSYSAPNLSGKTISLNVTAGNGTVSSLWMYSAPIYITSDPNVTVTFVNDTIVDGVVYIRGDMVIDNGGDVYADIYCDGNLTIKGRTIYGDIYCKKNITMTGGQIRGSMFAEGTISIDSAGGAGKVIYSKTGLRLGSWQADGIYFSGGDAVIIGNPGITGMLITKGNVTYTSSGGWPKIKYKQSAIDYAKQDNPFFFPQSGSGSGGSSGEVDYSNVILGQSISASGREN